MRHVAALVVLLVAGCARTIPEQDLRILTATPVAKLPAENLWKEYQDDTSAADARYWGKAVEISGVVTTVDRDGTPAAFVLFAQTDQYGIRAHLLDEQASAILEQAVPKQRLRLKCFVGGLDGHVQLKSCVLP